MSYYDNDERRFRPLPEILYSNFDLNGETWLCYCFRPLPEILYSNEEFKFDTEGVIIVSVPFRGSFIQILPFSLYINSAIIVSPAGQNIFLPHRKLETGSKIVKSLINTDAGQNLHSTRLIVHIPI